MTRATEITIAAALREGVLRLAPVSDTARLDAELLMAHALGVSRSELLLRHMADPVPSGFAALLQRRTQSEPVAYITGRQEFYGLDLAVNPSVLIPRADSETVIEAARTAFADRAPPRRVLDLGTGSGALLLAALTLWPQAEGLGLDRDRHALLTALRNSERVGINTVPAGQDLRARSQALQDVGGEDSGGGCGHVARAKFLQRDWSRPGWRKQLGTFDLILGNPPYVETCAELAASVRDYEPAGALFAGLDGLDDYRRLVPQVAPLLEPGGVAVFEIGAAQAQSIGALAADAGLRATLRHDLAGRPRALVMADDPAN